MVAVFFTFALSGPLPPKEMGVILGVAVLLDAAAGPPAPGTGAAATAGPLGLVAAPPLDRLLPDVRFGHA